LNPDAKFEGLIARVDAKIKRVPPNKTNQGEEFPGDISWEGFGYTYFLFAVLPENGVQNRVILRQSGDSLTAALQGPSERSGAISHYTLFIGPKDLDTLKSVGKGLEKSINFGYFGFISIPLLYVLHFFHRFTGSYGIDIILLTVLIKILMAPLTHKSMVSMKKMQKLQPQMERIKERFKDDKEKLNKEIMELYRRNSVNPLGGCLPMLLQFPVFIGLYDALGTPIELRHAPFLWIKDLSRPDWQSLPFTFGNWHLGVPVLTILMGASMFLQQWLTPSAGDPNQRKMMMLMPLVFTFMFVTFPAGLTIYWLVNNVLSIGQQYWINRQER
jgi:YidC/Oxa1 family membrane protein insertase